MAWEACCGWPCWSRAWTRQALEVPANLSYSVVPWFCDHYAQVLNNPPHKVCCWVPGQSVLRKGRTRLLNWAGTSTGHNPVHHQAHQAAHARKLPPPLLHLVNVQHRWRLQSRLWNTVWPPWWWASLLNCRSRLWVWMVSGREVSVLILTHLNSRGYDKRVFSFSFYIWEQKNNIHKHILLIACLSGECKIWRKLMCLTHLTHIRGWGVKL